MNENRRCSIPAFAGTSLVPLAGPRGQVVHLDGDADFVGQTLQLAFPQADAIAVGAAAVSGDDESGGLTVTAAADLLPPAANRVDREGRRVMGDADAHPTGIAGEIVNAIGDRPAQFLDQEVVHPHLFRLALATPLASGILEVADEFLFLGVD
jgi:hypothetical protein